MSGHTPFTLAASAVRRLTSGTRGLGPGVSQLVPGLQVRTWIYWNEKRRGVDSRRCSWYALEPPSYEDFQFKRGG